MTSEVVDKLTVKLDPDLFACYRSSFSRSGLSMRNSGWRRYLLPAIALSLVVAVALPIVLANPFSSLTDDDASDPVPDSVPVTSKPASIATLGGWRAHLTSLISSIQSGSVPEDCVLVTDDYYRCGPFPLTASTYTGSMCKGSYCMIYIRRQAPASGGASGGPAGGPSLFQKAGAAVSQGLGL